jgi:colanic acid/amylovoran biosynthesis glycosyltransferase
MRIAFFVNWFPVLSETFVMTAALGLIEAGCTVDIYAVEGEGPAEPAQHARYASLQAHARSISRPARQAWLCAPTAAARAVKALGWRALSVTNVAAHRSRALSLRPLFEAAAFQHRGRYDVLHAQFCTLAPLLLRHRAAGALQGAVVAHVRGYDIAPDVVQRWPALHAEALGRADWVVANCEYFRGQALQLGARRERSSVSFSGVDPQAFPFRARTGPAETPLRLLGVGRLIDKKGFCYAVRALALLQAEGVEARLRLIGEGEERAALAAEAAALGVADRLELVGALPHEAVAESLDWADLFLAPCVTGANGAQDAPVNVLKEAMLAGAPVIASRHGGIPELVAHAHTGLLTPERDAPALAAAVRQYLHSPALWAHASAAGRRLVEERFSVQASTRSLLCAYQAAIEARKERTP